MKRKLLTGLLALTLVVTDVPFLNCNTNIVHAEETVTEITNDKIAFQDEFLGDYDGFYELSTGGDVYAYTDAVNASGKKLDFEKNWKFIDDKALSEAGYPVLFYSEYSDAKKASEDRNAVTFEGTIPTKAFGKYVYYWVGIDLLDDKGNPTNDMALKLLRSKYPVTDWGDTDYQTFSLNDDNRTVSVFTIYNHDAKNGKFDAAIQKNIEIGGKLYTVTAVGDNALDNTYGSTAICSITIPSTVKKIGKNAFKGAKNLKTITIQGNVTSVGKNAFKDINKKAVFKIKASATNYKKIVSKIKKSGVAKTVTFKRVK